MSFLNIFGKKKTPKELLRENKRQIDRAIRDIDRERMSLQSQEKKLIVEMKKMAKNNQNEAVKVMAKSLIRMRHNITKYYTVKSQLQAVSMRMQVRCQSRSCYRLRPTHRSPPRRERLEDDVHSADPNPLSFPYPSLSRRRSRQRRPWRTP